MLLDQTHTNHGLPETLRERTWLLALLLCCAASGCTLLPDVRHKPQYHNPFPQLTRVAILPFRNQSQEPTLSGSRVSLAYYDELQAIPGFEVLPTGVVENQWNFYETNVLRQSAATAEDFQRFAQFLGVDAVLQGAITDYEPYYPPRMTLKVNWYAANPGFHPIPAGYGLPWGTKAEKKIPKAIRLEAERALAREQLKTQTPDVNNSPPIGTGAPQPTPVPPASEIAPQEELSEPNVQESVSNAAFTTKIDVLPEPALMPPSMLDPEHENLGPSSSLPDAWPDPEGFVPAKPSRTKPEMIPQYEPVLSHMKAYNGSDEDFTQALGEYFYFRDDARFGGWQAYLQRSEDFIRFCCHRHVVETLAARGGQLESQMILRWPIGRYER